MQRRTLLVSLGVTVIVLAMMAATGLMVWRLAKRTVEREILTPQEKIVDLSTLVIQVRELNRLETASMRVIHVGKVTQSYKVIPNALAGDEITFLATGDVIAGLDLSKLGPEDVWRSPDGAINLRLPAPEILVSRVDNEHSRVINRKTGVLRRSDVDLETRARQHAETNIRTEALKKGILPLASENGEKKLADLLRTLGFQRVRFVRAREAPLPR